MNFLSACSAKFVHKAYFPTIVSFVILLLLVSLGVTGSSSGVFWNYLNFGDDPRLWFGSPNIGRTDEWFVQTPWTISQIEFGFKELNPTFPGGMSAVIPFNLPNSDWSTLFKPELWGYFVLPTNQAWSWKWFLPLFFLFNSVYVFSYLFLKGRRSLAILLSLLFSFSPFLHSWFLANTFYTPSWAFILMASIVVFLENRSLIIKLAFVALLSYMTVVVVMGTYVPFALAGGYVAFAFVIAAVLGQVRSQINSPKISQVLKQLLPLLLAASIAICISTIWYFDKFSEISQFLSTSYPGIRLERTGSGSWRDALSLFSAPASAVSKSTDGAPFGPNYSESSTFLLIGLVLLVPLVYWHYKFRVQLRSTLPLLIGLIFICAILAAFLFVPGWDSIAHLLLFDRVTVARYRFAFGLANFLLILLFLRNSLELQQNSDVILPKKLIAITTTLGFLLFLFPEVWFLRTMGIQEVINPLLWLPTMLLCLGLLLLLHSRLLPAMLTLITTSLLLIAQINPIYVGVFDLRETQLSKEVKTISAAEDSLWVAIDINSLLPSAVLLETGVTAINGFQGIPSKMTWKLVDPSGKYTQNWNRLGRISWVPGTGEPEVSNPAADVVSVTFDSCSSFVQKTVKYVISDVEIHQNCMRSLREFSEYPQKIYLYEIAKQT